MDKRKFICIRCPMGCEIEAVLDGYNVVSLEGNNCRLGEDYVRKEVSDPRRVVTTTVKVRGGVKPLAPVWTDGDVPKARILELTDALRKIELDAPVEIGQVVLENALGLGINVMASGAVERASAGAAQ